MVIFWPNSATREPIYRILALGQMGWSTSPTPATTLTGCSIRNLPGEPIQSEPIVYSRCDATYGPIDTSLHAPRQCDLGGHGDVSCEGRGLPDAGRPREDD